MKKFEGNFVYVAGKITGAGAKELNTVRSTHNAFAIDVMGTFVLELTKLQLLDKVSSLVHFDYFSSQAWFFALSVEVFKIIRQKLMSLNVYEM